MDTELFAYLDQIHTTELGIVRIRRNLGLPDVDVVAWCRDQIKAADDVVRRGKNWYVYAGGVVITVNASRFTIITAHRVKG